VSRSLGSLCTIARSPCITFTTGEQQQQQQQQQQQRRRRRWRHPRTFIYCHMHYYLPEQTAVHECFWLLKIRMAMHSGCSHKG
ncbi:hypothetical protein K0M31_020111, partial [Melipona bicolor]